MLDKINRIKDEAIKFKAANHAELEDFRLKYLSKKGELSGLFDEFKAIASDQKREAGQKLNELKNLLTETFDSFKSLLDNETATSAGINDMTRPGESIDIGSRHPISIIRREICEIFARMGFTIAEGPEIEDDWHVFSALNFPKEHPARDMQDTFFISKVPEIVLRTHTSSVQVRVMETVKPPIRMIMPGRVFRNEAISARAHCIFHQVEGLYVAENVSFAGMKQTLMYFAKEMFGENAQIRLRPSFFPFTEPSAEMDIMCNCMSDGTCGCGLCKGTGWLEIMGCGMVHPNVLENCGIDSQKYFGYAFGMGIERIACLKFQTKDIRMFFENDVRFLKQFTAAGL